MNNVKFALMGEKGVGKSYIADIIEKFLYNSWQMAFADELKTMTEFAFDWIPSKYDSPEFKEVPIPHVLNINNLSYREIIVEYASILNRIEPGIFIRKLEQNIRWIVQENSKVNIFITDVRTQGEVQWCKDNHIPIIKIVGNSELKSNQGVLFENFVKDYETSLMFTNIKDKTTEKDIVNFFGQFLNRKDS